MAEDAKQLGNKAFTEKNYAAALQYYAEALKFGEDHTVYSNRSMTHAKLGDGRAALADATKCLEIKGDFAKGWLRKGQAYELLGQLRQAVEAYRSGLDMDPDMLQLKEAYRRADEAERRVPRGSPAPAPAPAPAPSPVPTSRASSSSSSSSSGQVQQTREKPSDLIEVDVPKIAFKFAKDHWLAVSLWVFGMLLMTVMPSPVTVTPEMEAEFDDLMSQANLMYGAKIEAAQQKAWTAQQQTNAAYGWFLNEHDTEVYNRRMREQQRAERNLGVLATKREAMERVARSKVGLWSNYGMAAVRDKFWYMINEGTGFAKRSTMWDAFFTVLSGRSDEGLASFVLQMLLRFVMNFTIGMFGALVGFFWTLVSIVQSFNPDAASAVLFYCLAGLAAVSMVATIVFGLYGTVGGTVYYVVKTAAANGRLEGGARRRHIGGGGARGGYGGYGGRPGGMGGSYGARRSHYD